MFPPDEIPFIAKQTRIVLENCGKFDAESLDEYLAAGSPGCKTFSLTGAIENTGLIEVPTSCCTIITNKHSPTKGS